MTIKDYFDTIKPFWKGRPKTVESLLKAAGATSSVPEDTVKTWFKTGDAYRPCNVKSCFYDTKFNEDGVVNEFRACINTNWKQLQESFKEVADNDFIDLETDVEDEFYWSLLRQLQKVMNLPVSQRQVTPDNIYDREMLRIFKEVAEECKIEDFINREPLMIKFKNLYCDYDLLSLANRFVEDVQSNIIVPFEAYKKELTYIKIFRFVGLVKEYKEYLRNHPYQITFTANCECPFKDMPMLSSNHKSEYERKIEWYKRQLRSLYSEFAVQNVD